MYVYTHICYCKGLKEEFYYVGISYVKIEQHVRGVQEIVHAGADWEISQKEVEFGQLVIEQQESRVGRQCQWQM